ncbi:sporulation protein YunB (plasmid) [Alkalihalophilus pseudofirmus OF4]|uniref:Sporulation protein YunB n=1 Tax=Alkalihalophilus pseudofirmus (strain ATCC BAA-2126 / JCM 17055 / OF4) TaxID=398511 RepID=D3G1U6_ALKPO|nr:MULTISPECIES: sporulation protein YunB [Alkalihalophilus]ADC52322.1 sporulation protein YunB [Alkalihalophilus pseudofirmus OF4]MED1603327.1 sporulation protein YunB [Alkalihalophilus marmarensis]
MRAMRRFRPRKTGLFPFRYVLLLSFVIFIALTLQGLWIIEKGIRPTLMEIARTEARVIATKAINDAVSKKIVSDLHQDKLFITNSENKIQFNTQVYNKVVSEATNRVQRHLKAIEEGRVFDVEIELEDAEAISTSDGGIIYVIPLGQATNNALLAHLGPKIPVRFSAIGDVKTDLNYGVINTGINNTTLSVNFDVIVDAKIVIPFATQTEAVKTTVPIGLITIQGEVPEYYSEGGGMILPAGSSGN